MLRNSDVEKFLVNKMGFERSDRSHAKYHIGKQLGLCIPAVLPITLQHGRHEVAKHILKQMETFFGLSKHSFQEAADCYHSRLAVYISFLVSRLEIYTAKLQFEPLDYENLLVAFLDSVPLFLGALMRGHDQRRRHRRDAALKAELLERIQGLRSGIGTSSNRVLRGKMTKILDELCGALQAIPAK